MVRRFTLPLLMLVLLACLSEAAQARVIYRCVRDGTVSLSTAPEPGSKCTAQTVDDNAAKLPNLWGINGTQKGTLYEREQDGKLANCPALVRSCPSR
jgi:hypothetical protein